MTGLIEKKTLKCWLEMLRGAFVFSGSGERSRGRDHPQREALFGAVDRNPPPTEHAEKENTAQVR